MHNRFLISVFLALTAFAGVAWCQQPMALTWEQVREKFEIRNPSLLADRLSVSESKAQEITAFLRPNPDFTVSTDGTQIAPYHGVWQPFTGTQYQGSLSQLFERRNKRNLRHESAEAATSIAESNHADLERTLLFGLRNAFIQALQAKAVYGVAKENLGYYDYVLSISSEQFKAGAIAQIDLDRLELQRVQFESDLQTAIVNVRTAKIQLLTLLNDRTPVESFDVTAPYDFNDKLPSRDEVRQTALESRPDLKAAMQSIKKAETDHKLAVANGSTDPTVSAWYTYNPSFNNPFAHQTVGASVNIPLRIFDRNQGEKLRTQLDIDRSQRLLDVTQAQVFSDVDSAYATVDGDLALLRPYKEKYLQQAVRVRDTMTFSYQHGGAALLDFLSAENDYRAVELSYVNLVGSYLTAAGQLNLAAGREVIP